MDIAAVASFVVLLVAWIAAPDRPRPMVVAARSEPESAEAQALAA